MHTEETTTRSARQRRPVQQTLVTAASGGGGGAAAVAAASPAAASEDEQQQQQQQQQSHSAAPQQLHELRVVSLRQAVQGGGFSDSFERQYAGWAVSVVLRWMRVHCDLLVLLVASCIVHAQERGTA